MITIMLVGHFVHLYLALKIAKLYLVKVAKSKMVINKFRKGCISIMCILMISVYMLCMLKVLLKLLLKSGLTMKILQAECSIYSNF